MKYAARVPQPKKPLDAKNFVSVSNLVAEQDKAVQRSFAAFDIDGTLIRWQLYHAVTDALAKKGYFEPDLYQKVRRARLDWKKRAHPEAFKAYEKVLVQAFEQIIQTLTVEQFETAVDEVIAEYKDQVYAYTRQLIKDLKAKDYFLLAISGSQIELVRRIAAYYGFDDCIGTDYIKQGGLFTGDKTFHAEDKKRVLEHLIEKHQLSLANSLAIGDSASDIPMLEMVEQPIAFNPERKLFDFAKTKGWSIVLERKNVTYQLYKKNGDYFLSDK